MSRNKQAKKQVSYYRLLTLTVGGMPIADDYVGRTTSPVDITWHDCGELICPDQHTLCDGKRVALQPHDTTAMLPSWGQ